MRCKSLYKDQMVELPEGYGDDMKLVFSGIPPNSPNRTIQVSSEASKKAGAVMSTDMKKTHCSTQPHGGKVEGVDDTEVISIYCIKSEWDVHIPSLVSSSAEYDGSGAN
ncbi:Aste57867_11545 [Aphanomyces stellatus]|uniref:Aste57867_11545 protein n=1 Tax=Aphanomyces stellatus TaxID=120398 RepID=A0A485KTB6_9STRA|nr:hypothetical protein As57867_011502 [Aphanomyces stellatus]VFT88405.1 Aste57867_11545 [Aphanomyces stellatus]